MTCRRAAVSEVTSRRISRCRTASLQRIPSDGCEVGRHGRCPPGPDGARFKELNVIRTVRMVPRWRTDYARNNWKDTWRVSVGANYHYNSQMDGASGVALIRLLYQMSIVPYASARSGPHLDCVGGQYKLSRTSTLDFGYAHLFVKDANAQSTGAAANPDLAGTGYLTGSYSNSVDILSVQYAYNF